MEKGYDHVNWGNVDWVLDQMGFRIRWRNWMKICVMSPSFSVLVNDSPKGFFKGSRSLKQGNPLSPYLFIMVAYLLGRMVAKAELVGLMQGHPPGGGMSMPFIQFADDPLLW